MTIVPNDIEAIFRVHIRGVKDDKDLLPWLRSSLGKLTALELVFISKETKGYEVTKRGIAWIAAITDTPLPTASWKVVHHE